MFFKSSFIRKVFLSCSIVAETLENLGELSKVLDPRLSPTESAIEMFLENICTFYDRQIMLLNIVLLSSPYTQNVQAVHQGNLEKLDKLNKSNPLRYIINDNKNKKAKFYRIRREKGRRVNYYSDFHWVVFICLALFVLA